MKTQKKAAHTTGPWHRSTIDYGNIVADWNGREVCRVTNNNQEDRRLIAAAPQLFAACLHALETIEDYIKDGAKMETAKVLRTAIAKAEGR